MRIHLTDNTMNLRFWKNALFCCCLFAITACSDEETVNPPAPTEIPKQPAELAEQLAQYNSDIAALQLMVDGEGGSSGLYFG